jgi:hypothetical protein
VKSIVTLPALAVALFVLKASWSSLADSATAPPVPPDSGVVVVPVVVGAGVVDVGSLPFAPSR